MVGGADMDWASTPLGPTGTWSPALTGAADLVRNTSFPATLLWGPEFVLVYNEAYVPILAEKHPGALGAPAREVFPEAWPQIGPLLAGVRSGGGAVFFEDALVPLQRGGSLGEAYFTFAYSPVHNPDGTVEGVIDLVTETTQAVIDGRRQRVLYRLRDALADVDVATGILQRALPVLCDTPDLTLVDVLEDDATRGGDRTLVALGPAGSGRPRLAVTPELTVAHDAGYDAFLRAIGVTIGQAFDRLAADDAQRRAGELERRLSETLQRSLLPTPAQPDHLEVAVRYLPAAEHAQIGGDWYDAFLAPDGALTLVIGDVTGHDRLAAAAMAHLRNLLRGVVWSTADSPAGVLDRLDGAMVGLRVGTYATGILARIEQDSAQRSRGLRTLRWSNAGHPPPVLIHPDGAVELLEREPELLLGLGRQGGRRDHTVVLEPDARVVFYTDGLIERPGSPIDDGLAWLREVLEHAPANTSAETLCDHLLAQFGDDLDDDVALLTLHAAPEN